MCVESICARSYRQLCAVAHYTSSHCTAHRIFVQVDLLKIYQRHARTDYVIDHRHWSITRTWKSPRDQHLAGMLVLGSGLFDTPSPANRPSKALAPIASALSGINTLLIRHTRSWLDPSHMTMNFTLSDPPGNGRRKDCQRQGC